MEVDSDDSVLRTVADGGSMDYSQWPDILARLIPRLEKIVRNDFPIPPLQSTSSNTTPSASQQLQSQPEPITQSTDVTESFNTAVEISSQTTNKENDPPTPTQPLHDPLAPVSLDSPTLPPQIHSLLTSITQTMTTYFSTYPPHTIQRLSELILNPKQHYRTLPSYLHAVDRVVHVTSGANIYPLPAAIPDAQGAKILSNGLSTTDPSNITWGSSTQTQIPPAASSISASNTLGSDESLGGALLTPIPWLKNQSTNGNGNGNHHNGNGHTIEGEVRTESTEMIDGPNGPGGVETVSISVNGVSSIVLTSTPDPNAAGGLRAEGGVTQGELLRQEQQAGVVPAAQLISTSSRLDSSAAGAEGGVDAEEETPHARGPEEIGMEDMGPHVLGNSTVVLAQGMQGIDVEAAVGRKAYGNEDDEEMEEEEERSGAKREAADDEDEDNEKSSRKRRRSGGADDADEGQFDDNHGDEEQLQHELEDTERKDEDNKDIVLVDADGRAADEKKVGELGENIGADAIDTTGV